MGGGGSSPSRSANIGGAAAQTASVQTVGGEVTNPQLALQAYAHTFMTGGEMTMIAGVILLGDLTLDEEDHARVM